MGPSFPVLQRVRQPLHGLVEALALRGAGFEDLEGSVLQRLQPEGLVNLWNIDFVGDCNILASVYIIRRWPIIPLAFLPKHFTVTGQVLAQLK